MPIFDQGYQHWSGRLAGYPLSWLTVTRWGVRSQWERPWTRRIVIAALFPALGLGVVLIFWGLFEQQSQLLAPLLMFVRDLPEELRAGPRNFRLPIWTLAFNSFLRIELFFSMVLVLLVGPDLISQDLRFNAMPLYFARPLRRFEYFLGKLGVIGFYLALVTVVPILLAYLLGVIFSLDYHVVFETARLLGATLAYALVVVVSAGSLMLALSSLSKSSRFVAGLWLIVWLIGGAAAGFLVLLRVQWGPLVSFVNNLDRIREALLDPESARTTFTRLFNIMPGPRPPVPKQLVDYPWEWSAITLAVVFGLSLCVLSLRVRSLDRLR